MERVLRKNDHKGGWKGMAPGTLVVRSHQELHELEREIILWQNRPLVLIPSDLTPIIKEAVDVANFAMMLLDNLPPAIILEEVD